jgi:hypothetical protein
MNEDDTVDIGEDMAHKKRKTTYDRLHPTDNPKPPKRSKAEVQAAAAEKKATALAKKKERVNLLAAAELENQRKRQRSLNEVAAMEDTIQRKQRQHQLQAERPDLQTMETYQTIQEAHAASHASLVVTVADTGTTEEFEEDFDVEIVPPQSVVDTDSDGGQLGVENFDLDGEDEDDEDLYTPADDNDHEDEEDPNSSCASVEQGTTFKKKSAKTQKVRIPFVKSRGFSIYSQVVGYQRENYAQIFKPIARSWHRHMPQ